MRAATTTVSGLQMLPIDQWIVSAMMQAPIIFSLQGRNEWLRHF